MTKDESPDPGPDSQHELLRAWEQRIDEAAGDAMAALAELLGERQEARNRLFRLGGTTVLGCRLESILGAGGMGVTYDGIAQDGARVAVKLVAGVGHGPHDRFEQECRVLQGFAHEAIVRYRDHGILGDGTGVLVMDLVRGADLERVLLALQGADPLAQGLSAVASLLHEVQERGSLLCQSSRYRRRILRLLASVAEGLHAAHELGVVHRDIKPANILVREDLSPVVIDFGLARDLQQRVSMTQSGLAMGTLAYMAPEQLGRDPGAVDRRTDVYAVGLLLYRTLSGVDLAKDVDEVLRRRRRSFLLDANASRTLPVDVQAILYRCLDPRPDRRYDTAAQLADDLRAAAGQGKVRATMPSLLQRTLRRRRLVAGAACVGVLLLATLAWLQRPIRREVVFAANWDPMKVRVVIDGEQEAALGLPVLLPLGPHEVHLLPQGGLPRLTQILVEEGHGPMTVPLWTRGLRPTEAADQDVHPIWLMTGHQWSPMGEGLGRDQVSVDGRLLVEPAPGCDAMMAPGVYEVAAVDGRGRKESQRIQLEGGPVDVQLLPAVLSDVDGAFRRTWSTVASPLPPDVQIETNAVKWFGDATPSYFPLPVDQAPCAFTVVDAQTDAVVRLRVQFPALMQSAVVAMRGRCDLGSMLEVQAGFEGEPSQPWPLQQDGALAPRMAFAAALPRAAFVVEARMRSGTGYGPRAFVRFLDGVVFGGHWVDEPPCFAIVADEGALARLPTAGPPTWPERQDYKQLPVQQARIASEETLVGLGLWGGAEGRAELWLRRGNPSQQTSILRYGWPSLDLLEVIGPGLLHPRRGSFDGCAFPTSLAELPDLDGDGLVELALADTSSEARGKSMAGLVTLISSRDRSLLWRWPLAPAAGKHGDEHAGLFGTVGDWNNDGYPDLAVNAGVDLTNPPVQKAGMVGVVCGRTGTLLWERRGSRHCQFPEVVASSECAGSPRHYLLIDDDTKTADGTRVEGALSLLRDGAPIAPSIWAPMYCSATLVREQGMPPQVLVLGCEGDGRELYLERYAIGPATLDLMRRRLLPKQRYVWRGWQPLGPSLRRLGDLDLDGVEDVLLSLLDQDQQANFLVVSGSTLEPLGAAVPPVPPGMSWAGMFGRGFVGGATDLDLLLLPAQAGPAAAGSGERWFFLLSQEDLRAALR